MHKLYYQPEGVWVGDIMPYAEDGEFFVYHQRDTRDPVPFGQPFGWALAKTEDFVKYKDLGESLKRGSDTDPDQFIQAGSFMRFIRVITVNFLRRERHPRYFCTQ